MLSTWYDQYNWLFQLGRVLISLWPTYGNDDLGCIYDFLVLKRLGDETVYTYRPHGDSSYTSNVGDPHMVSLPNIFLQLDCDETEMDASYTKTCRDNSLTGAYKSIRAPSGQPLLLTDGSGVVVVTSWTAWWSVILGNWLRYSRCISLRHWRLLVAHESNWCFLTKRASDSIWDCYWNQLRRCNFLIKSASIWSDLFHCLSFWTPTATLVIARCG